MKHKSLYLLGSVAVLSIILAGCSQSSPTNHSTQSSSSTQTTSQQSSGKQSSQLWNSSKDQQLADFINQWAPTMGQSYTKYDGHHDLRNKAGEYYPKDLGNDNVNGSKASIGWAPSGKGSYEYNVVAIYNYDRPGNAAMHITYAFAFHNGQPVALVDQSTNGGANWTPTKNTDVESNFERIAQGQKSNFSKSAGSSNSSNNRESETSSSHEITSPDQAIAAVKSKYDPEGKINWSYMSDGDDTTMTDDDGNEYYWIRGQEKDFKSGGAGSYDGHDYYVYKDGTIKPR